VTAPGAAGIWPAFFAEVAITCRADDADLADLESPAAAQVHGLMRRLLVAAYITFEAPISGMSMNPARTFASAVPARQSSDLWIYFTAPVIGMLAARELYMRTWGASQPGCAKLHHENPMRCIFCGKPGRSFQESRARKDFP
jgi:aquaporin Z